mgnify:CR=1 FL=1
MLKIALLFLVAILVFSSLSYGFVFPKTDVTILGHGSEDDFLIEVQSRMMPIEVRSSQQLKSVKLQINDKKPRTICRNDCWEFKSRKPINKGLNVVKIILENYNEEREVHRFLVRQV